MFLEHNSNIVLEILDIIMLYENNVSGAYFGIVSFLEAYRKLTIQILMTLIYQQ